MSVSMLPSMSGALQVLTDSTEDKGRNEQNGTDQKDLLPAPGPSPVLKSPWRIASRSIGSNWFLVPQGTGILAVTLRSHPYQFAGLSTIAIVFWGLTIVQFLLVLLLYILRAALFPHHVRFLLRSDNTEIACLASIVISFTSIIQMLVLVLGRHGRWGTAAHCLWWVSMATSIIAVFIIPYVFANLNPPGLSGIMPNTQLPIIAAMTCAACGAQLCQFTPISADSETLVIVVSYFFLGLATPLTLILDTLSFAKFVDRKGSEEGMIDDHQTLSSAYQTIILAGPWSQGSNAAQGLGQALLDGKPKSGILFIDQTASSIGSLSVFMGLLFWAHATFWWVFALAGLVQAVVVDKKRGRTFQFSLTAWSLVFPWGVYTHASQLLGTILPSAAFKIWSTVLLILLVAIWGINTVFTVKGCFTGSLLGLRGGWKRSPAQLEKESA